MYLLGLLVQIASLVSGIAAATAIFALLKERRINQKPIIISSVSAIDSHERTNLIISLKNRSQMTILVQGLLVRKQQEYFIETPTNGSPPFISPITFRSNLFNSICKDDFPIELTPGLSRKVLVYGSNLADHAEIKEEAKDIIIVTSHGEYKLNLKKTKVYKEEANPEILTNPVKTNSFIKSRFILIRAYLIHLIRDR